MNPGEEILLEDVLRRLKMPAVAREYREHARQARETGESYEGFLLALASRELDERQSNQVRRRLTEARFPVMKTL
jgi:DNA replication protein DnaC